MAGTTSCSPCIDCTTPVVIPCPPAATYTANSCPDTVLTDCVAYSGPDNNCFGIESSGTPTTLTSVITSILSFLSTIWTRLTSNSLSVTVTGGLCNQVASVELVPSSQTGNILILGNDGKPYVPQTLVTMGNSKCVSWQVSGPVGNQFWTPVLDFNCLSLNISNSCAAPTGVSIGTITTTTAIVSFTALGGVSYDIMVNGTVVQTGASSPYTITGLTPATNYTVIVRADCSGGSTGETLLAFSTLPILTCNTPSNLQITSV